MHGFCIAGFSPKITTYTFVQNGSFQLLECWIISPLSLNDTLSYITDSSVVQMFLLNGLQHISELFKNHIISIL